MPASQIRGAQPTTDWTAPNRPGTWPAREGGAHRPPDATQLSHLEISHPSKNLCKFELHDELGFFFPSQRFLKDSAAHHIATRQMTDILFVIACVDVGEFCDRGMRRRRETTGAIKNCPALFSVARAASEAPHIIIIIILHLLDCLRVYLIASI